MKLFFPFPLLLQSNDAKAVSPSESARPRNHNLFVSSCDSPHLVPRERSFHVVSVVPAVITAAAAAVAVSDAINQKGSSALAVVGIAVCSFPETVP